MAAYKVAFLRGDRIYQRGFLLRERQAQFLSGRFGLETVTRYGDKNPKQI